MIKKLDLNINAIVINQDPYKGETPFKIISESDKNNFITLVTLNRDSFYWDYYSKVSKNLEDLLLYYENITNLPKWLEENKNSIIWRTNVWKLERLFNE